MNIRSLLALHVLLVPFTLYGQQKNEAASEQKLTAKDLVEHAAFWVEHLPKLDQEEMHLLCNYLYLEAVSLHTQATMQRTLISIHTASPLLNKQLSTNNEAETKNIAKKAIKELTELHNELLPARAFLSHATKHCLDAIEQSDFTVLKKVIMSYQQYGQAVLACFVKQDMPQIEKVIANTKDALDKHTKVMAEYTATLDAVVKHENPSKKEGIDNNMTDLNLSMTITDGALGCMNETTLICASTKTMSADLFTVCALYHKIFYNVLYQTLKDEDAMFPIHFMFNENGLIEEDERTEELPSLGEKIALNKKYLK